MSQLKARLHGASVDSGTSEMSADCTACAFLDPDERTAERAQRSLDSGKDVLLLAGPWLSHGALGRLSEAAHRAGTRLAVLNPERFVPSRQLIREQLDSGRLGVPGLVRMHRWANSASAEGEMPVSLILDLDIAMWLMGETPDRAYAVEAQHLDRTGPIGRAMQVHLGFPSGGMALLDFAQRPPAHDSYQSLSVIGSSGAAYADDHQNMQLSYGGAGPPQAHRVSEQTTALVTLVQWFVTDLLQRETKPVDGGSPWTRVLEIAGAVRHSIESRQAVELAP
jgi:predicted dehydrogenase